MAVPRQSHLDQELERKQLWVQELTQERKLVVNKVNTDDKIADVGKRYIGLRGCLAGCQVAGA